MVKRHVSKGFNRIPEMDEMALKKHSLCPGGRRIKMHRNIVQDEESGTAKGPAQGMQFDPERYEKCPGEDLKLTLVCKAGELG